MITGIPPFKLTVISNLLKSAIMPLIISPSSRVKKATCFSFIGGNSDLFLIKYRGLGERIGLIPSALTFLSIFMSGLTESVRSAGSITPPQADGVCKAIILSLPPHPTPLPRERELAETPAQADGALKTLMKNILKSDKQSSIFLLIDQR